MKDKKLQAIQILMLILNVVGVLFYAAFLYYTTQKICNRYTAREFIEKVSTVPRNPGQLFVVITVLVACFVLSFCAREYAFSEDSRLGIATLIFDLIIGIVIVCLLDFNYNGILLLVSANIIAYTRAKRRKYYLVILIVATLLITNYELASIRLNLFNISDYIQYYDFEIQQYLLIGFNLVTCLNIILFIVYCVYVIEERTAVIDEVNSLYQKLSDTNRELNDANIRLQEYAILTEKVGRTKERNRLAREIHDSLGHTLTGISTALDACITTVEQSPTETKKRLEYIAEIARQGLEDVRRSVHELKPDLTDIGDLQHTLMKMIKNVNTVTNTRVYFESNLGLLKLGEDQENTIYRVVQESITNAIRHGKASEIWVKIQKTDTDILINVQDNGVGVDKLEKGFGLTHITERVEFLGGTVAFDGSSGFKVTAKIPIRWGENND
ncbi:MAG: HATPase-c domain-containing protein [Thermocaproicibacter melissae]|jgi:signal transduction histidine kinase|uniref:histidine kinase n=1 Tax=Thermocaproicibacter melissae TaxID=2966552 RepID=UPI003A102EE0